MTIVRGVSHRLKVAGVDHLVKSYDMASAFQSGEHDDLVETMAERFPGTAGDRNSSNQALFEQKRRETIMRINAIDGTGFFSIKMGDHGRLMRG